MTNSDHSVYLLIGSDTGDRELYLSNAVQSIGGMGEIISYSSVYESEPWGFESEKRFLNMAVLFKTKKTPYEILAEIKDIESKNGRIKSGTNRYESRTLDIDILFYDNLIINDSDLTIPHSQLHERLFALKPLSDIASDLIHPVFELAVNELMLKCPDSGNVDIYKTERFLL